MNNAYYQYFNELKTREEACLKELDNQTCNEIVFLSYIDSYRRYIEHVDCKRWAPELFNDEVKKHIADNIDNIVSTNERIIKYHYYNTDADYYLNSFGEVVHLMPMMREIRDEAQGKRRK